MTHKLDSKAVRSIDIVICVLLAITALIAATGLVGWFFHVPRLLTGWRSNIPIRFNSVLCLLIASICLWVVRGQARRAHVIAVRIAGAFISVVALLTLIEYAFAIDLGIDQFLWTDYFSPTKPGRMSWIMATSLLLTGIFLIFVRGMRPFFVNIAQIAAAATSMAAQWAVLDVLLRHDEGTGIATNGAFALLCVSLAMLLVRNQQGFFRGLASANASGQILRRVVPTAVIAPIVLGWLRWRLTTSGMIEMQSGMVLLVTFCTAALFAVAVWTAKTSDAIDAEKERLQEEINGFFRLPLHSLLCIIRPDGYFQRISPSWETALGYSLDEILRKPYVEFVHEGDRERTLQCANQIYAGQPAIGFENRYRAADGAYRWLVWNALAIADGSMYAIAEDITERKRMDNELRENAERSRLLIQGLDGTALYMLDGDGRIVTWNAGAQQLTGYSEADVIGKPVSMLYTPEEAGRITPEYLLAMASRPDRKEVQTWRLRKDGTRFLGEGYISALRDSQGQFAGFAKIVRDVTERVAVEQKIRDLNEELEHRVQQRTAELAASNRELEAFAYSVSHDLRAPLRHLDGFVSLLRRRSYSQLDASAQHYIDSTMEASRRMGTLIDELLQFSRLGRTDIHRGEIDIAAVISEVRRELQPELVQRVVRWRIGELPHVSADRGMVRQIMQNLLANAIKFTRHRPEAEITIGGEAQSDGFAVITVSDNGAGFDMQYYDKLFGVFQRLHSEDEFEGTGIGLANVRRMVDRHGGRVWAESVLGAGATFHFTLPCTPAATGEHDEQFVETYSAG